MMPARSAAGSTHALMAFAAHLLLLASIVGLDACGAPVPSASDSAAEGADVKTEVMVVKADTDVADGETDAIHIAEVSDIGADAACLGQSTSSSFGNCAGTGDCNANEICVQVAFGAAPQSVCEPNCGGACPCTDGSTCKVQGTGADTIASCVPSACPDWLTKLCDDANVCTKDVCNPQAGCSHLPMSAVTPCSDGSKCTTNDHCGSGVCAGIPLAATLCDDGNVCTDDNCQAASGCVHANNGGMCDDGEPCTAGDQCETGACIGASNQCACMADADCAVADDGNACNGVAFCDKTAMPYKCAFSAVVVCQTATDSACTATKCVPATGNCVTSVMPNGLVCSTNLCEPATCKSGACTPGSPLICDDGNTCTVDSCSPSAGCQYAASPAPASCDDNNACTVADSCIGTACVGGAALACDDANPCTIDACNALSGCAHTYSASNCNDNNPCTDDSCLPASGCQSVPNSKACDDGSACTTGDICSGGGCAGAPVMCSALDQCHVAGLCGAQGCSNPTKANGTACSDSNACTANDTCTSGVCSGTAKNCDDGIACTSDSCGANGACVHGANNAACADGNVCTTDICASAGCLSTDNSTVCNDSNACTTGDVCIGGTCAGTSVDPLVDCDDGNVCTIDACAPAVGCQHTATPIGNSCGTDKACDFGGVCAAAPPGMALIPGATFWMGCNAVKDANCMPDESPQHKVTLSSYYMDKTEVTAGEWQWCVSAGKCTALSACSGYTSWPSTDSPASCINASSALAYCEWRGAGYGLPTEAQWEMAARGSCEKNGSSSADPSCATAMRTYPWGEAAATCKYAWMNEAGNSYGSGCGQDQPWTVGAKPAGDSPYGLHDMAGNLSEWTQGWEVPYADVDQIDPNPQPAGMFSKVVVRGGVYTLLAANMRSSARAYTGPGYAYNTIGFRCVKSYP